MSILAGRLRPNRRSWTPDPDVPTNGTVQGWGRFGNGLATARAITPLSAMRLSAVYACQRVLADSVSSTSIFAARRVDGRVERLDDSASPLLSSSLFRDEEGRPMETWDGIHRMVASMTARGTGYAYIVETSGRYATGLLPLYPDSVTYRPNATRTGWDWFVGGQLIDRERLVKIPLYTFGGPAGIGPLDAAIDAVDIGLAAQEFAARFYGQGISTTGVVEVPGDFPDEDAKLMAESFAANHGGLANSHLPVVLTGGASYKPISVTPDQAQFLETRKFQRNEIAMIYGVPPHMIGDVDGSTSWGTGIEAQSIGFVRYTLRPYIKRIEAALSRLTPAGTFIKFDLSDLLEADTLTRYQAYLMARNGGWLSIDDIRLKENQPPVPEIGDDHLLPLNSGLKSDFAANLAGIDPVVADSTDSSKQE